MEKNRGKRLGKPQKTYYTSSFTKNIGKAGVIMVLAGVLFGSFTGVGFGALFGIIPGAMIMLGMAMKPKIPVFDMHPSCFAFCNPKNPQVIHYHTIEKIRLYRYVITFFLKEKGERRILRIGLSALSSEDRQELLQFFSHRKGKAGFPSSAVIEDKRLSPKALVFVWSLFWVFLFSIGLTNSGYQNRVEIAEFWKVQTLLWKGECPKCDLQNIDLSEQDLSSFNLAGANLEGANLSKSSLKDANFEEAILASSDLSEADLSNAIFSRANLLKVSLDAAKFSNTNFLNADLSKAILSDTDLRTINLKLVKLKGAHLGGAVLDGMDLSKVDFSECKLGYAQINYANLFETKLNKVSLYGTIITETEGERASFVNSKIRISNFSNSNFSNSNFSNSYVRGNKFINVKFVGANFTGAILEKNNFTGADLSGATWVNGEKCQPKSIGRCILASKNKE